MYLDDVKDIVVIITAILITTFSFITVLIVDDIYTEIKKNNCIEYNGERYCRGE